jgi:hypothetical protein
MTPIPSIDEKSIADAEENTLFSVNLRLASADHQNKAITGNHAAYGPR